jgi:glycosyltransferase involved in cell wall biosynthesis
MSRPGGLRPDGSSFQEERRVTGFDRDLSVLLVSGLPLTSSNSFYHQLALLARFLGTEGVRASLCGPADLRPPADALLLLGYPDQFLFLGQPRDGLLPRRRWFALHGGRRHVGPPWPTPAFLWAQFSRPPAAGSLAGLRPVPLSEATRRFLEQAGVEGVGPVIPHGVDPLVFQPLPAGERWSARRELGLEERFVVGAVAANTPRKRLDLVIEAFARFARPREPAALLLKTDRRVSYEGIDLLERLAGAGVAGRAVVVTEPLHPRRMARLYAAMDVYLNLSEWEGFCIPVVEAMACGVSVVCPPVQGPGEIVPYPDLRVERVERVQEGRTELLAADPQDAARALGRAFDRPALRRRLGRLGRREAAARYDIRQVARRWAQLIGETVGRKAGGY